MSERIEVLSTGQGVGSGLGDTRQTFTVNTGAAPPMVGLNVNAGNQTQLVDGDGNAWLHAKDNFLVLSVGITLPYLFGFADRCPCVQLGWIDSIGGTGVFSLGALDGRLRLPLENYELAMNTVLAYPVPSNSIKLYLNIHGEGYDPNTNIRISMINAPAALNGVTLPVTAWMKIVHNDRMYPAA